MPIECEIEGSCYIQWRETIVKEFNKIVPSVKQIGEKIKKVFKTIEVKRY